MNIRAKNFLRRAWPAIPVLLLVPLAATALTDLMPGDPAAAILGDRARPQDIAAVDQQLGLDRPLPARYFDWLGHALSGDLGRSIGSRVPVWQEISQRLPVTAQLAVMALVFAVVVAFLLSIYSASHPGPIDRIATGTSAGLMSVPPFVVAIALSYLATTTGALPPLGWVPLSRDAYENLRHALVPALVLAIAEIPVFHRLLRADIVATLQENFILNARARGLPRRYIMFRHALRPSLFSVLTVAGISFGRLLGGTVIVETIFSLPGLGALAAQSIYSKDIPTIQGIVVFVAALYLVINLLVDLAFGILDPRVATGSRA
ncbi:ABC transporter permease [Amycolatopsis sp. FDAARGOS 1241]|uniref:ABC transporter permease n=1 Tax=Amycolatopsis sp. FDAARGOS 1241 TaxID=2778070 RepID=UPI001952877C|nr:ABC transporter permease [Amycolatopsis sp. FDAARGOS 1241]QRP42866.1 ABC transporter permease [Amycolatopsis sp. FDAARGOS 1241]